MASQYDLDKKAQLEAMNAAKAKHGQTFEEEVKAQPIVPKTFKEKWVNYWYHYKALTFGMAVLAVFVIMFAKSILFPTKYDASITIVTNTSFVGVQETIVKGINTIMPDYDQNGEKNPLIIPLQYGKDTASENAQFYMANQTKLMANLSSIENFLYIMDSENYNTLKDMGIIFVDLTEVVGENDRIVDGNYDLTGTELSKQLGVGEMFNSKMLCLVDLGSYGEKKQSNKKTSKIFENETDLLKRMIDVE